MLYQSMTAIALLTSINVVLLLWMGTQRNPVYVFLGIARELFSSMRYLLLLAALVSIFLLNYLEQQLEALLVASRLDFTPWVFQLEGAFVQSVQHLFHAPWLTPVLVYFYITVFQALIIGSFGVYLFQRNHQFAYATGYAVLINYVVAMPFYLFFPVHETWNFEPAGVSFFMLEAFPDFEAVYRPLSGLDNCFPSLHTSLSITMAVLAARSGNKIWMLITSISAAIIVFSIFYLGIHWLTDMIAGTMLGVMAASLGVYFGELTMRKTAAAPAMNF
ncbi:MULTISPECIES: phosphatase PAP2 family protein [Paenibacillus]|nr:phosphatase PAP2 family protein [Paenibacillus campinasensis]